MGRPRKNVETNSALKKYCTCCGKELSNTNTWKVQSQAYAAWDYFIPTCKDCIETIYADYFNAYTHDIEVAEIEVETNYIEKKTIKRICMKFDIYYSDKVFETALKTNANTMLSAYMKAFNLIQFKNKTFDKTLEYEAELAEDVIETFDEARESKVNKKTVKFFGTGFSEDDYSFLQEQYNDWTTRHECKTKAQEEVFKQICFTQLELLKATRAKQDTKDLTATFQKLLETAKLQPKQNHSDTLSDTQTFGTLIDKWENTRPLPDIDEELKDVDKIGLYIDVFFRGHLSKMMGIKNAFSNLYTKYIKKYTVNKPEYDTDDNSEVIFDAIFGGHNNSDE